MTNHSHLVGERFWSGAIESEEELTAVCRYVVANPVRAGLVARTADWPWSGWRYGPLSVHIDDHERQKRDRDGAVHGEERSVQSPQIIRPDERMLVRQEHRHGANARPVPESN